MLSQKLFGNRVIGETIGELFKLAGRQRIDCKVDSRTHVASVCVAVFRLKLDLVHAEDGVVAINRAAPRRATTERVPTSDNGATVERLRTRCRNIPPALRSGCKRRGFAMPRPPRSELVQVQSSATFEGELIARVFASRHVRTPYVFDGKLRETYLDTRFWYPLNFLLVFYKVREDTARVRVASFTPGRASIQDARTCAQINPIILH